MLKNTVFDIGRVMTGFEWNDYVGRLFKDETVRSVVTAATFGNPLWQEMDRGVMQTDEIFKGMLDNAPDYEAEIREALDRVDECVERKAYAIPWIEELKAQGYRVLFLSNYSEYVMSKSVHAFDFLEHMDGGVFSCDAKYIKPNEEIYRCLFDKYEIVPAECVFIDDSPANIETAQRLGMKGIVFENYEQAHAELIDIMSPFLYNILL